MAASLMWAVIPEGSMRGAWPGLIPERLFAGRHEGCRQFWATGA